MSQKKVVKTPLVGYEQDTAAVDCPYGNVARIVTGGAGGVANVHRVTVSRGDAHFHEGYDEVYYVLEGNGLIVLDGSEHRLCPGAVAVVPRKMVHSIRADRGETLSFIIFGTPAMSVEDPRFLPRKP
ncbi:MAG: cupin domain-containing protein [Thermodesulfobacteriota bacterium]